MSKPVPMVEIWRGPFLESMHTGHAVICDATGDIIEAWGDPDQVMLSRSSSKMIQALPLIESGAADAMGLTPQHLALACASHGGAPLHTQLVRGWLATLGLTDDALRCGAHMPYDPATHDEMLIAAEQPCQFHNNCSGKHSGFLTLSNHLGGGSEYIEPDHPVQKPCWRRLKGSRRKHHRDLASTDAPPRISQAPYTGWRGRWPGLRQALRAVPRRDCIRPCVCIPSWWRAKTGPVRT